MRPKRLGALVLLLLAVTGCRSEPESIFEQERLPDAEGVVSDIGPAGIKLAGGEGFEIDASVQAFTTRGYDAVPLGNLNGRYVHLGVNEENRVVWIASIGVVSTNKVYYTGVLERSEGDRLYFDDGTVLTLGEGVEAPEGEGSRAVVLDAERRVVVELRRQG